MLAVFLAFCAGYFTACLMQAAKRGDEPNEKE